MTKSDRSCQWILCLTSWLAMGGAIASCDFTLAQIVPDSSLGSERSVVTPNADNTDIISGGATRGANLFHSFEQLSVQTGSTAFFNNAADVQNIISRVTGLSISNIDGLIRVNSTANLFLLNPNGIIFGSNARLDIGGSFVASTANSLNFADGFNFSATAPQTPPLLTVNVPLGLQFGEKIGDIRVQGIGGFSASQQRLGLIVPLNKTLALVGGNVTLEGAYLNVPGGRIEVGSVTGVGQVNLNQTNQGWTLNYQNAQNLGNIQLSRSFVDISIEEDSSIQSQAETGAISIRSSQLNLGGSSIVSANTFTSIPGPDVKIDVQRLIMQEGSTISSRTFGAGSAGNLTVNAQESVEVSGTSRGALFPTSLTTTTFAGTGNGGSLMINTPMLLIRGGAAVAASTFSDGKGGTLTVTADTVELVGRALTVQAPSSLTAQATGTGDAGSITINTQQLLIREGAQVSANTLASGKGGTLTVTADTVELVGRSFDGQIPSGLGVQTRGTGDGGNVRINTQHLLVRDGAGVFVESRGAGNAGNLVIDAGSIDLDDGTLTADTRSINTNPNQPQATISLVGKDSIVLRRNSNITTNATGENVIGGNINIDTDVLVGLENSDINANSTDFRGGQVAIETISIFGTQLRNAPTLESDITATGASPEFSGTVELNILDIDPSQGLVELPENIVDASQQIAQGCTPRGDKTSSFVATGRGGLSDNPSDILNSDAIAVDLVTLNPEVENRSSSTVAAIATTSAPLVEAQGWIIGNNGEVLLTANTPTVTPHSPGLTPSCHLWQQVN